MKWISKNTDSNEVDYHGIVVVVPNEFEFLATNKDGELFAYQEAPVAKKIEWYEHETRQYLGDVDLEGLNWKESRMEVR